MGGFTAAQRIVWMLREQAEEARGAIYDRAEPGDAAADALEAAADEAERIMDEDNHI